MRWIGRKEGEGWAVGQERIPSSIYLTFILVGYWRSWEEGQKRKHRQRLPRDSQVLGRQCEERRSLKFRCFLSSCLYSDIRRPVEAKLTGYRGCFAGFWPGWGGFLQNHHPFGPVKPVAALSSALVWLVWCGTSSTQPADLKLLGPSSQPPQLDCGPCHPASGPTLSRRGGPKRVGGCSDE